VQDDLVNFKVNKISSTKTALPYEYYSLPFCRPDPIINSAENLGEVLRGDRILNSLYQVRGAALPPPPTMARSPHQFRLVPLALVVE
jgi:hypothetical protein